MLGLATRNQYQSLLDAISFSSSDALAIRYIATGCDPIEITRQQLRDRALSYASALHRHGIREGHLVIIAHTQSLASIYAFWGAMAIGAIPSMFPTLTEKMDADHYIANLTDLIAFSDVRAIITTPEFADTLPDMDCEIIGSIAMAADRFASIITPDPHSIAFLQHSSGTTGLQKGVALSHARVLNQLASYSDALALTQEDVIVSWLPLYHDMGLIAGFLLPLMQGVPLVLMSPFDWVAHPALLLQTIDDYGGTLCWLPNFAYNHMARRIRRRDREGLSLASVRGFINCSEPVHHESHQQFLDAFENAAITPENLWVSYAMAENTFAVTQTPIHQAPDIDFVNPQALAEKQIATPISDGMPVVSCGVPIANVAVRIVDKALNNLPDRHIGEVLIQSDAMLTHYHKRPNLQPFTNGWYHTGDMGYIANEQLYIVGRKKDIIINAGKNIYPQDIESIINQIDGIHKGRCVVFGVDDTRDGTELITIVAERSNDSTIDDKALKKTIRQRVAQQSMITVSYVTLVPRGWLIKTSSGKLARAANRDKWQRDYATS